MCLASLSLLTRELRYFVHGLALLAIVVVMAGCGPDEGSSSTESPDAGPVECDAGQMPLEGGGCQPAGLPPDMPCPPGEVPIEGGGCHPAGLPPDMPCPPGEVPLEGGGCHPAGLPPDMPCPPGEASVADGCQPAGVPPEACGQGFETDGQGGCTPILPATPCPPGKMAIPGETQCREVAPCGSGDYGTIPVDATTKFVNGAYAGNDSNGTQAKPWKTIQDGIDSAKPGAIVAVAAGSYTEDLLIKAKRVRLWGRCPAMVSVVGTGATIASLTIIYNSASQSEVHSLAITGPGIGIGTSGSSGVFIDRVWIHDTMDVGLDMNGGLGPSSVTMSASLIETAKDIGVSVDGSGATIEATIVRDTQPGKNGMGGHGIHIQDDLATGKRATLMLRTSLLERNHDIGVRVISSDATIEATIVRDTQPGKNGMGGHGIGIRDDAETQERSTLTLRTSFLEKNHEIGVYVVGSDAEIEATVVRTTQPNSAGKLGHGISSTSFTPERSKITLRNSILELNHGAGVTALGSDATIDATVVRATQPQTDGTLGSGVLILEDPTTHERSLVTLRASLLEQNHEAGVYVQGSDAMIDATVVRDTQPLKDGRFGRGVEMVAGAKATLHASLLEQNHDFGVFVWGSEVAIDTTVVRATQLNSDGISGRGISVQDDPTTHERSALTLRASLLEQNHEVGVYVQGSDATIDAVVVRDTQPNVDGMFGHGLMGASAKVTLHASVLEKNHDVGVSALGSEVTIEATVVRATQINGDGISGHGIEVQDDPTTHERSALTLRASLLEQNHEVGVYVQGSDATIEAAVVRDTQPNGDGMFGRGIDVQDDPTTHERSVLTLRASLLEQNHGTGVLVSGSNAGIDSTVVRATQPESDGMVGTGIFTQISRDTNERSVLTLRASLLEQNHAGVAVLGSDATIETTVVRANQPDGDGIFGRGIEVQNEPTTQERSALMLRASLLEQNHDIGIIITGSDATIDATIVRDTQPTPQSVDGMGIAVQDDVESQERSTAGLRHSVVENSHGTGVLVVKSDVTIEATVVRATQLASDGTNGRGIGVEGNSTLLLRASLVEENHEVGVLVVDSDATIEDTVVRATQPEGDGTGGDGIAVAAYDALATATITSTRIEDNARAGISNFSAAVILVSSTVQCNLFNLDGEESVEGQGFTFDGSKDNLCGCGDKPDPTCPVVSEHLSAPEAISPVNPSK